MPHKAVPVHLGTSPPKRRKAVLYSRAGPTMLWKDTACGRRVQASEATRMQNFVTCEACRHGR